MPGTPSLPSAATDLLRQGWDTTAIHRKARNHAVRDLRLSRGFRLGMPLVRNVQRSVLPDLPGLHYDICNVETCKFRDLNGIEFRGVASSRNRLECTGQRPVNCLFLRSGKTPSKECTRSEERRVGKECRSR